MRLKIFLIMAVMMLTGMGGVLAEEENIPIRIVHTGNLRGIYSHTDTSAGFEQLKTIADVEGADLLLDSGNAFCGEAAGALNGGDTMAVLFEAAGYDAVNIGAGDLNQGAAHLQAIDSSRAFTMLSTNITDCENREKVFSPYYIKTIDRYGQSIRIGVVSFIDPALYTTIETEKVKDLNFDSITESARTTVNYLRETEGCQIVIAMTELSQGMTPSVTAEELAMEVNGIDVILDNSDSEETLTAGNTLIVRTGSRFNAFGQTVLQLDPQTLQVVGKEANFFSAERAALYQENRMMKEQIEEQNAVLEPLKNEVIAQTDSDLQGSPMDTYLTQTSLGQLIAQAYRVQTGADIGIENSGAIRASIGAGTISRGQIYDVLPFNPEIVVKTISGGDLKSLLEANINRALCNQQAVEENQTAWPEGAGGAYLQLAGVNVTYDSEKPAGSRIVSADIGGSPLDWDTSYTVAMNRYVADSPGFPELASKSIDQAFGVSVDLVSAFLSTDRRYSGQAAVVSDVSDRPLPEVKTTIPQETTLAESVGEDVARLPDSETSVSEIFTGSIGDKIPMLLGVLLFLLVGGVIYQNQQR